MRALIIDDSRAARLVMRRALEGLRFTVVEAADVQEGRAALAEGEVALVLLDWHLPDESGVQLLKEMRAASATRAIPVLMVTMEVDMVRVREALQAGATEYIMKPLHLDALVEKLALLGFSHSAPPPGPGA